MPQFYESLTAQELEKLQPLIDYIQALEPQLVVKEGRYMKIESALLFEEEGFSKYALTKNKNDFSIHNMVMYGFPEVAEFIKANGQGLKIQKGCLNYKSPETADMQVFKELFKLSAAQDYMGLVRKYRK
jgi:hypothetical protein